MYPTPMNVPCSMKNFKSVAGVALVKPIGAFCDVTLKRVGDLVYAVFLLDFDHSCTGNNDVLFILF